MPRPGRAVRGWELSGNADRGHVLYLDREHARHGAREVANKADLLSLLHRLFGARVQVFQSGEHSVRDTVALFGGASIIIGPHGSALQNMFWCRPGTTVIELYPKGMLASLAYSTFWVESQELLLQYWAVPVDGDYGTLLHVPLDSIERGLVLLRAGGS